MQEQLLLFPFNGNICEFLSFYVALPKELQQWEVLGILDDNPQNHDKTSNGVRVLGGREKFTQYSYAQVLAQPGRPENFRQRSQIINDLNLDSERFATFVHPQTVLGNDVSLGYNTILLPGTAAAGCCFGNHIFSRMNSTFSHGDIIGDYTLIGAGVNIAGNVNIGANCYIGDGANIINDVTVGAEALIGLGANVVSDTPARVVAFGDPVKTTYCYMRQQYI